MLDNRVISDLANGDVANLEFPNEVAQVATGKNGNSIYAYQASGHTCNLTLRVLRGSGDDKWLNSRFYEYKNDPPSFVLLIGQLIKRAGDGKQNVTSDIYSLGGGIITKLPEVKENVDGDVEQAISIWAITFTNSDRSL
jgi:hypothetical protein